MNGVLLHNVYGHYKYNTKLNACPLFFGGNFTPSRQGGFRSRRRASGVFLQPRHAAVQLSGDRLGVHPRGLPGDAELQVVQQALRIEDLLFVGGPELNCPAGEDGDHAQRNLRHAVGVHRGAHDLRLLPVALQGTGNLLVRAVHMLVPRAVLLGDRPAEAEAVEADHLVAGDEQRHQVRHPAPVLDGAGEHEPQLVAPHEDQERGDEGLEILASAVGLPGFALRGALPGGLGVVPLAGPGEQEAYDVFPGEPVAAHQHGNQEDPVNVHGSLRISLAPESDEFDVDEFVNILSEAVKRLREMSPLWNQELDYDGVMCNKHDDCRRC